MIKNLVEQQTGITLYSMMVFILHP